MKISNNVKKIIISVIFSIIGTISVPYIIEFNNTLSYTNNMVSIIIFIALYYLFYKTISNKNIKLIKKTYPIGIMFSLCLVLGLQIDKLGELEISGGTGVAILSISFIMTSILVNLYNFLDRIEIVEENKIIDKKKFLSLWIIIFLCWIPVFLAVYPGYFCYDVSYQLSLVTSNSLNAHNPILHTLLLGNIIETVHSITNSWNMGIAIYTVLQMLVISACLTYSIYFLSKHKVSKKIQMATLIYYAFFPVIVMFGICSTKDSLFTSITLVTILFIIDMLINKEKFFSSMMLIIRFILAIFLMLAFRNNALYCFILFIPILIYFCKGYRKKMFIIIVSILIFWGIYTGPIHRILNVQKNSNAEMLSVPLQQVARVYNYNYDNLNEEQLEAIYDVINEEEIKKYDPKLSDSIKAACNINILKNNYIKYLKLWIEIGIRNPKTYIESFLENTLGYWYPNTIIDGYCANWDYETETTFFNATTEEPGERNSRIPVLEEIYYKISRTSMIQKIPVVSMLFSVGFMFWILVICIAYNVYRKRNAIVVPLLLILFLWITVIFGPIALPRYILILFFAFPLFVTFLLNGSRFEINE